MMFRRTLFSLRSKRTFSPADALALASRILDLMSRAANDRAAAKLVKQIEDALGQIARIVDRG